jgi:porin
VGVSRRVRAVAGRILLGLPAVAALVLGGAGDAAPAVEAPAPPGGRDQELILSQLPSQAAPEFTEPTPPGEDVQPPAQAEAGLTGDWGGRRARLRERGVDLDLEFTQFLQGLASGTENPDETSGYGARLDAFLDLDSRAIGLWEGGKFHVHLEYVFGPLSGTLGEAFFPTNAGMAFPTGGPDSLVATSLNFTQNFGDKFSLQIGKISILDVFENDLFFGGWGIHRFANTIFVAPPSGLVPPVFFGGIATLKLDPVTVSFWVYDPKDRTQEYWPDDLFAEGVTYYLSTGYATMLFNRPTRFSLTGIYSSKSGVDFDFISQSIVLQTPPAQKTGAYSVGFQFSHLLVQSPNDPARGWGVFLRGAAADGNPNYIQNSIIAGIGGSSLFGGRELDSFGIGYYYYDLSNSLTLSVSQLPGSVRFEDEQGFELYYSYAVTPWLFITADVQYILPPRNTFENALIAGLRANLRF